ncbi:hypothetical protein R3P38DRAFT_1189485 [Favolaschia claudopus]|uniref:Uncharacterized protein n=1 Tax=Favolaschia claudopus TaxID=2862362 RepID=A0AAW0E1B6_9AGAR
MPLCHEISISLPNICPELPQIFSSLFLDFPGQDWRNFEQRDCASGLRLDFAWLRLNSRLELSTVWKTATSKIGPSHNTLKSVSSSFPFKGRFRIKRRKTPQLSEHSGEPRKATVKVILVRPGERARLELIPRSHIFAQNKYPISINAATPQNTIALGIPAIWSERYFQMSRYRIYSRNIPSGLYLSWRSGIRNRKAKTVITYCTTIFHSAFHPPVPIIRALKSYLWIYSA